MIIFKNAAQIGKFLSGLRSGGQSVGFVPTMGALHEGHVSLVAEARRQCGVVVASIFVNPTQFNNQADFDKYPSTLEADIMRLSDAGADVLFLPSIQEIYPEGTSSLPHYDLGYLETVLEGRYRPGHFQGVCQVVDRLLSIVAPDRLFMGQKDYQQCMVVAWLIREKKFPVVLVVMPTLREADGLAMSSRNIRLDKESRALAPAIFRCLEDIRDGLEPGPLARFKEYGTLELTRRGFVVDYVEIADAGTLEPADSWDGRLPLVALIAAFLGEVRLIDNLALNPTP
jgi:pantoate--beta-alanine ligase